MSSKRAAAEGLALRSVMKLPERVQKSLLRRPVVIDGNTLAPECQIMLAMQRVVREPAVEDLPVAQARAALRKQSGYLGGRQPVGAVRDLTVPGAASDMRARLYVPTSRVGAGPAPTLLYLHGGGWTYGDLETYDAACRHLAEHAGVQVLAVEYRLAPEDAFPAAVDDALAGYRWLVANPGEVNADVGRLAVGGDSAGGNLAAVVALQAAREGLPLAFQLLIYPATDFSERTVSRDLFSDGFFLTGKFMDQCQDWYLQGTGAERDPRASVLLDDDIPEGVAPAFVITAAFDPLRDEGEAYAALLEKHGVEVEAQRYSGMIHGFFNMVAAGPRAAAYNREIAGKLRAALT